MGPPYKPLPSAAKPRLPETPPPEYAFILLLIKSSLGKATSKPRYRYYNQALPKGAGSSDKGFKIRANIRAVFAPSGKIASAFYSGDILQGARRISGSVVNRVDIGYVIYS